MNWADAEHYIDYFRTDRIMQQLQDWHVGNLTTNPWFLGGFVAAVVITYFLGLRVTSAFIVGLGGFILAVAYTVSQGTGVGGLSGNGIYVIIGGGAIAVALFLYLFFVKSE